MKEQKRNKQQKKTLRIELTEEQKKLIKAETGKDAALERELARNAA